MAAACSGDDGRGTSDSATDSASASATDSASASASASASESAGSSSSGSGGMSEGSSSSSGDTSSSGSGASESDGTTTTGDGTSTGVDGTTTGEPVDDCADELKEIGERPPLIWISNTTVGTVSKINTETALIEGRYITNSAQAFQPSRTTVNDLGDMLVGHRESGGGVTKIAGNPAHCVDLNGNNTIDTSTGFDDVRPWGQDECVLWHTDTPGEAGGGARAVARELPWPNGQDPS
ncbi:MAG: hypothetical protein KC420_08330 [Myxococcales bacterium]|nr:hypothetical protein [Myxococcales bacterium]